MKINTIYYLVSNVFMALVPFILLPLLTRTLTVSEYGMLSIFMAVVSSTASFIGLNAVSAANRFYFDDVDRLTLARYNGVCLQVIFLGFIISIFLVVLFKNNIYSLIGVSFSWVLYALLIGFFHQVILLRLGQWQIRQHARKYLLLQSSLGLGVILVTLVLLNTIAFEVEVVILSRLLVFAVFAIISLVVLFRDKLICIFNFSSSYLYEVAKYSFPLLPHTIGLYFISFLDRFFVLSRFGSENAGYYMVAVQFSMAFMLVFDALNRALIPQLYKRLKSNCEGELVTVVRIKLIIVISAFAVLPLFFYLSPILITSIAGDEYLFAVDVLNILVLGQVCGGLYLMFTNYIFYAKATSRLAGITTVTFSFHLLFLYLLPQEYGIEGVAWVFVITRFNQFVLTFILSKKYVTLPWKKGVSLWR